MRYAELDTPALLIDREILMDNLRFMQDYADRNCVALRPHAKTHKMPAIAAMQIEVGAKGITVAKTGEAEVMAANGINDIFIANEIVGAPKLARIRALAERGVDISFGLDSIDQADMIEEAFADAERPAHVSIEIEVGENRSGIIEMADLRALVSHVVENCPHVAVIGVFSHDGNSYMAADLDECRDIHVSSQRRTLEFAAAARELGAPLERVSIGSTPSLMHNFPILDGITEMRPGTYPFMDASQAHAYGSTDRCAATVLATVMSRPTAERVILDVGAKGITMQSRHNGIVQTAGLGAIVEYPGVSIFDVFDEHAIIYDAGMRAATRLGDKVRILPVHICPVVNLHESAFLISEGEVIDEIPILAGRKIK